MDRNLILNDSFNALVFENRHKDYGAFELRKRYSKSVLLSGFVAAAFFSFAMGVYFVNLPSAVAADRPKSDTMTSRIVNVLPDKPEEPKEPKQRRTVAPPKGPDSPDLKTPQIVNRVVTPLRLDSAGMSTKGDSAGTGHDIVKDPCPNCKDSIDAPPVKIDPPKFVVTDPPKFDVNAFFQAHTKYPQPAKDDNIEGVVYLQWIVDTEGNVTDIHITKGKNPWLDKEALRVARLMPRWDPAKDNGKVVSFVFNMPVRFKLK